MSVLGVAALEGLVMAWGGRQECPTLRQRWATARTQDTVVADFGEPLRQHVLQEAADELFNGQRPVCPCVARALLDAEGHLPICALCQAVIGDGDPVEVGGEVGEDFCAGAGRLTMGYPSLCPDLGRHVREETGGSQGRLELAPEELGERVDGHQPIGITGEEPR